MGTQADRDRGEEYGQQRILVVCTRYIGDTVLAIPFLRNLRQAFPGATIEVCAEGSVQGVLADCPYIDRFVAWKRPAGRRSLGAAIAAIRAQAAWLGSRRYTRAYLLKRSLSACLMAALAGIPKRIGLAGDGRLFLTRVVTVSRGRHQASRYLDLLRAEGIAVDDGHAENWTAPETCGRVAAMLARLPAGRRRVFIAPQSTDGSRRWPADRWAALVEWLVERQQCDVVLCGGPGDIEEHDRIRDEIADDVASHVHDFTRDLSLRETGALVARMDTCVGVDTGLVHLAASHGVPVAVLFGPTDPNQWSPWSPRAVVVRSQRVVQTVAQRLAAWMRPIASAWPAGKASMDDIGVEDVVVAVTSLLPESKPQVAPVVPSVPLRTLDLREGSFRYEVVAMDATAALPAAEPATKPLAQAH